jgi:flagellar hook-length control protein FliK
VSQKIEKEEKLTIAPDKKEASEYDDKLSRNPIDDKPLRNDFMNQIQKEVSFEKILENKAIEKTAQVVKNEINIIEQVVTNLKVDVKENVQTVRMTLHPETLGDITLKITTLNGAVNAQFLAENERVRQIIESNFNTLRDVLKEQGVDVAGLSVSVGQEGKEEATYSQGQNNHMSDKRISSILEQHSHEAVESYLKDVFDSDVDFLA